MSGMIFRVTKSFEFAYGHRLLNYDGKCRYLHGHNGVVEIDVESSDLDKRGMVIDFNEIRDLIRRWVEDSMDHKMILCKKDPMVEVFRKFDQPMYLMAENPIIINILYAPAFGIGFLYGLKISEKALRPSETRSAFKRKIMKTFLFFLVI